MEFDINNFFGESLRIKFKCIGFQIFLLICIICILSDFFTYICEDFDSEKKLIEVLFLSSFDKVWH